jgi:hypothetical protein
VKTSQHRVLQRWLMAVPVNLEKIRNQNSWALTASWKKLGVRTRNR